MAYVNRCAPNAYTAALGRAYNPNFGNDLIGYCDDNDVQQWIVERKATDLV